MFAISPTDIDWFNFLRSRSFNTEINFWTPTPWNVHRLKPGDRLYFMLKSPIRKIGGYGHFLEYKNASTNDAWNEFGFKNGCLSKEEFTSRLDGYKSNRSKDESSVSDSQIGCIVLSDSVFFDEDQFLDLENYNIDFSRYIVKIKYFSGEDPLAKHEASIQTNEPFVPIETNTTKLKKARQVTERKGQGQFRSALTKAYENRCCITGERVIELLEAAHIQPYLNADSNHVQNGLLLRSDFHKLYDNGLLYIHSDFTIKVSPQVKSEYYRSFEGNQIILPKSEFHQPSKEALESKRFEFRNE